jgi:hypothetical protein
MQGNIFKFFSKVNKSQDKIVQRFGEGGKAHVKTLDYWENFSNEIILF